MVNRTGYTRIAKPTSGINRENESSAVRSRVFSTISSDGGAHNHHEGKTKRPPDKEAKSKCPSRVPLWSASHLP